MIGSRDHISYLEDYREEAELLIKTMGKFQVWRNGVLITDKEWGRDATMQLFQFLVTARNRKGLHKEQILDRLWPDVDSKAANQLFKVALHGINKALEPNRKSRTEPRYIARQGVAYQLDLGKMWIDVDTIEKLIEIGNQYYDVNNDLAIEAFNEAVELYEGQFLPNRIYEDWSSEERERIQLLILGALIDLSEIMLEKNPNESIRLAQKALQIDRTWEDAYRIIMQAYFENGNRPMVIKTYNKCVEILEEDFGITPLPATQAIYKKIRNT